MCITDANQLFYVSDHSIQGEMALASPLMFLYACFHKLYYKGQITDATSCKFHNNRDPWSGLDLQKWPGREAKAAFPGALWSETEKCI